MQVVRKAPVAGADVDRRGRETSAQLAERVGRERRGPALADHPGDVTFLAAWGRRAVHALVRLVATDPGLDFRACATVDAGTP